jgi:hypothetical protein
MEEVTEEKVVEAETEAIVAKTCVEGARSLATLHENALSLNAMDAKKRVTSFTNVHNALERPKVRAQAQLPNRTHSPRT